MFVARFGLFTLLSVRFDFVAQVIVLLLRLSERGTRARDARVRRSGLRVTEFRNSDSESRRRSDMTDLPWPGRCMPYPDRQEDAARMLYAVWL